MLTFAYPSTFVEMERKDIIIPLPTTFLVDKDVKENMNDMNEHHNTTKVDIEPKVKYHLR